MARLRWRRQNALRNLWLAVRHHVDSAGPGDVALTYREGLATLMAVMTVLSVIEIGVVHLIVPWTWARVALVVLSILGLLVLLGFWAGLSTHPHLVRTDRLTIRYVHYLSVDVPWSDVESISRTSLHEPTSVTVRDGRLHLPPSGSTNLLLTLTAERDVPLLFGRTRRADRIAFQADDPAAVLVAVREHLP